MKTKRHSDGEILDACLDLAHRGIDPTSRSLRAAGIGVCGRRLLRIRTEAIASGELMLPLGTRIDAAHKLMRKRRVLPILKRHTSPLDALVHGAISPVEAFRVVERETRRQARIFALKQGRAVNRQRPWRRVQAVFTFLSAQA